MFVIDKVNKWVYFLRIIERRYKNSTLYRGLITMITLLGAVQCIAVIWVLSTSFFNPWVNYLMLSEMIKTGQLPKQTIVSYSEIADPMKRAVISTEDAKFLYHHGIDFEAIEKAEKRNKSRKQKAGASTISQQVAKNLFLWPGRSFVRKALELYFTAIIESFWSKKLILLKYLNWAEMGPGIYGCEAASKHYFKKSAKNLTAKEAASIAAILPSPRKWSAKQPSPYLKRKISKVQRQMAFVSIP